MGLSALHAPSILMATVMHKRMQPKVNQFRYRVYYLCFALSAVQAIARRILSVNRFNLSSYYTRDHVHEGGSNEAWARGALTQWGLDESCNGEIMLITMPRLLGYVFNPVSFWMCLDDAGRIRAVISEVCNTFGDKHCYVSFHDDHRPIAANDWMHSQKVFHVSPFLQREGEYRYQFSLNEDGVRIIINHETDDGLVLATSLVGKRVPLSSRHLLAAMLRCPLVTFKVIALIHWQALKLVSKGIRYHRRPEPPEHFMTR